MLGNEKMAVRVANFCIDPLAVLFKYQMTMLIFTATKSFLCWFLHTRWLLKAGEPARVVLPGQLASGQDDFHQDHKISSNKRVYIIMVADGLSSLTFSSCSLSMKLFLDHKIGRRRPSLLVSLHLVWDSAGFETCSKRTKPQGEF